MRSIKRIAGPDKAGQDKTGQDKAGQGTGGQHTAGQHVTGRGEAGRGEAGRGKAGPRLITALRLLLFVVFAAYGTIKLLGGQYDYGDWTISNRTPDGTSVVWAFYGYSEVYGRFTGLYELVPALMLLSRRTVTLGAMALFAVSLNITVMDFAYGYPAVKYFSLAYTLLCLVLVVHGRDRLVTAFWERPGTEAAEGR